MNMRGIYVSHCILCCGLNFVSAIKSKENKVAIISGNFKQNKKTLFTMEPTEAAVQKCVNCLCKTNNKF